MKFFNLQAVKSWGLRMAQKAKEGGKALAVAGTVAVSMMAAPVSEVYAQTGPTIDTAAVTDFLSNQVVVGIGSIGAGMLLVAVVFAGYRWIRGAAGGN